MAQQVVVKLIDDLDGSEADTTVRFGLENVSYEIDLTNDHAQELRESLKKFVDAARKTGKSRRIQPTPLPQSGPTPKEVRAWAQENNVPVNPRGRISSDVVEKYLAANK